MSANNTPFNTGCTAKMDILIKKCTPGTKRNDKYLKLNPALCGRIRFDLVHNHTIGTSGALKYLKISYETQKAFKQYFNNGMGVAEACRYHESLLMLNEKPCEMLANGSINPTKNVVYYLHKQWTLRNYGSVFEPIAKLQEKLDFYKSLGMKIALLTNPWTVLVVTPIMESAQHLQTSGEIIFCDSTASCDTTETTVTILLTITKAGAVPIAVLLHEGQSIASYQQAYNLLKENNPYCFGGNRQPLCFMTDDSKAEKSALANVYESSKQLLCFFHVLQKEWRWLCEKKNEIPLEKRQHLMNLFRKVMYSETQENLDVAIMELKKQSQRFPNFVSRFETFYARSNEWLYFHRKNILIRGNNTNNYAEASIRVLKDIILHRTKGYNCVALVDFICFVWEEYFKNKLLDYAHGRRNSVKNNYLKLCSKIVFIKPEELINLGNGLFQIRSCTNKTIQYNIDVNNGVCSCPAGINGAFCKHQAYLHRHLNIAFINAPAVGSIERSSLGRLALGQECPEDNWFKDLAEVEEPNNNNNQSDDKQPNNIQETLQFSLHGNTLTSTSPNTESTRKEEAVSKISKELSRLETLSNELPPNLLEKFAKRLQDIKTAQQLYSAIRVASKIKGKSNIKVQPTAVSGSE